LVHDSDTVAEPFGLVEVVGGQHGGHVGAAAQAADQIHELVADAGVQPDRWLVEEQDQSFGSARVRFRAVAAVRR